MMLRNILCAAALAVPLVIVGSTPSVAGSDVNVRFGVGIGTPHYGYGYRDRDYDYGYGYGYAPRGKMSCWQARRLVRDSGFRRVSTIECNGRVYTFAAVNRRGKPIRVAVNARTDAVWRQ